MIPEELCINKAVLLSASLKVQKGQTMVIAKLIWDCDVENIDPCILKVKILCMQFLRSYHLHKAVWYKVILKVQKGHTKVNVDLLWIAMWWTIL